MSDVNFLIEVKDCPQCNDLMYWWQEDDGKRWRCEGCEHTEPYQSSVTSAKRAR